MYGYLGAWPWDGVVLEWHAWQRAVDRHQCLSNLCHRTWANRSQQKSLSPSKVENWYQRHFTELHCAIGTFSHNFFPFLLLRSLEMLPTFLGHLVLEEGNCRPEDTTANKNISIMLQTFPGQETHRHPCNIYCMPSMPLHGKRKTVCFGFRRFVTLC